MRFKRRTDLSPEELKKLAEEIDRQAEKRPYRPPISLPGYEWCIEHGRWERADERVDFACSDTFLGYYYERGLTNRRPGEGRAEEKVRALEQKVEQLERAVFKEAPEVKERQKVPPKRVVIEEAK